ncbi:MAG TPA: hypothetical protein VFF65_00980, partial [Phycisphaerales bacterium]|nr:hypothetical protein [Phycisphaerales bacterium]
MNEPSGTRDLAPILAPFRARQRRLNAARWACDALLLGAAIGCLAGATARIAADASPLTSVLIGAACSLLAAIAGAVVGYSRPVHDLTIARAIDRAADSDDRFASAVQLAHHHRRHRVAMIVDDAAARVAGTTAASALPARLPRTLRWVPVPLALLALVLVAMPGA